MPFELAGLLVGVAVLWVSDRISKVYIHFVQRETRRESMANGVRKHLGHKAFLALDFVALSVLLLSLESLIFGPADTSWLGLALRACLHFSAIVAIWLLWEGLRLAMFYRQMAEARPDGDKLSATTQPQDSFFGGRQLLALVLVALAALPLIIELGVGPVFEAFASNRARIAFAAVCFLGPQLGLFLMVSRAVLPWRRRVYEVPRIRSLSR